PLAGVPAAGCVSGPERRPGGRRCPGPGAPVPRRARAQLSAFDSVASVAWAVSAPPASAVVASAAASLAALASAFFADFLAVFLAGADSPSGSAFLAVAFLAGRFFCVVASARLSPWTSARAALKMSDLLVLTSLTLSLPSA